MLKSRNQIYSKAVYDSIKAMLEHATDSKLDSKYKGLCKRAGSLLRTSGLMQMVAFMEARGHREEMYWLLLRHLQVELIKLHILQGNANKEFWLAEHLRNLELPAYMALTRKVLLLLNWHKRLAETMIQKDAEDENND